MSESRCPQPGVLQTKDLRQGVKIFSDMLKIDTRNPDSDETKLAAYLRKNLSSAGIKSQTFNELKNRPNLIARLKADKPTAAPLLLTGHMDTVPWDLKSWKHHPLSAREDGGYIYGRGAIDMKNHIAYSLMALLLLKRNKVKLKRDIIFAAVSDEEAGCTYGSRFLVEKHPSVLSGVEYALNEVGGFPVYVEGQEFFFIQTEEKGVAWYEVTFHGKAGHGSLASKLSANNPLSEFIRRIFDLKMPAQPSRLTKQMINSMSADMPFFKRFVFRLLKYPKFNHLVLQILPADKRESFHAMTHTTLAPTVIKSSDKINVVPGESKVFLDTRFVPDSSQKEVTELIRKMLPEDATLRLVSEGGPVHDIGRNEVYDIIEKHLMNDMNQVKVIPYTLIGFSDAQWYQKLGIKTLGFSPVYFPPDVVFSDLFHGHNERIYRPGFEWGLDIFYRVVREYCEAR